MYARSNIVHFILNSLQSTRTTWQPREFVKFKLVQKPWKRSVLIASLLGWKNNRK